MRRRKKVLFLTASFSTAEVFTSNQLFLGAPRKTGTSSWSIPLITFFSTASQAKESDDARTEVGIVRKVTLA